MIFATDHIFTRSEANGVLLEASKSRGREGVKTQPQLPPLHPGLSSQSKICSYFIHGSVCKSQQRPQYRCPVCGSINSSHKYCPLAPAASLLPANMKSVNRSAQISDRDQSDPLSWTLPQ